MPGKGFLTALLFSAFLFPGTVVAQQSSPAKGAAGDQAKALSPALPDQPPAEDEARTAVLEERLERRLERKMEKNLARRLDRSSDFSRHGAGRSEEGTGEDSRVQPPWGYPWYPWYPLPQSYAYGRKDYPPSITHTPALGLQHNYPFAYQMGIRVPDDSDSLYVHPNMSPYVGVVGLAKAEAREEARRKNLTGDEQALRLIKEKKYKEAGRILADQFRDFDDARYPLLLAEVLFALGKPLHAEALLRHALESKNAEEALPEDVASHFATPEEFEGKLQDLGSSGESPLLKAYLQLHSKSPDQGLDYLQKLSAAQGPLQAPASLLYRHYLGKVFVSPPGTDGK